LQFKFFLNKGGDENAKSHGKPDLHFDRAFNGAIKLLDVRVLFDRHILHLDLNSVPKPPSWSISGLSGLSGQSRPLAL